MIENEEQYLITKQQYEKIEAALRDFDVKEVEERVGSQILGAAELDGLLSEEESLKKQLMEYEYKFLHL